MANEENSSSTEYKESELFWSRDPILREVFLLVYSQLPNYTFGDDNS